MFHFGAIFGLSRQVELFHAVHVFRFCLPPAMVGQKLSTILILICRLERDTKGDTNPSTGNIFRGAVGTEEAFESGASNLLMECPLGPSLAFRGD